MRVHNLREVAVIGVGMSVFGKQTERSLVDLGTEACGSAIKDAGISPKEIEVCYCANLYYDAGYIHTACLGQEIGSNVGVVKREITNVENACAGGATAVRRSGSFSQKLRSPIASMLSQTKWKWPPLPAAVPICCPIRYRT